MDGLNSVECERLKRLGDRIGVARRSKGLTLVRLAEITNLDEKTIRTAIDGGRVRPRSIVLICKALDLDFEEDVEVAKISCEKFGSYNFEHFRDYEGSFISYRRSFKQKDCIIRSVYNFTWCNDRNNQGLKFEEYQRYQPGNSKRIVDFSQKGDVYISNETGIIQLLTSIKGALRLINLTKMQIEDRSMSGIILTLAKQVSFHQPSTSPVFMQKSNSVLSEDEAQSIAGPISATSAIYVEIDEFLADIEQNVGVFALTNDTQDSTSRSANLERRLSVVK